jgi:cobalt-zinc-cadmium efflux system membrane fusion protein
MKNIQILRSGIFGLAVLLAWAPVAVAQFLEISDSERQLLGIEVQAVAPAASGSAGQVVLRVGFSPDGEWAIKTPLPGLLYRAWVQVGDRVLTGDPLMTVRSPEAVSLQRDYLKARAEFSLQEHALARDKKLSDAGSVSSRRWQETQYAYSTAQAEFAGLRAQLKLAGFSDQDLERLSKDADISPDITLRSPADAIVLERPAMLGDHLEGTELLARLGEPNKLVLEGVVSSQAATLINEGMKITLQDSENEAFITFVSSVIDPASQTVQLRAEPSGIAGLIPGQLMHWDLQTSDDLLTVPASAIVKLDGIDVAYVKLPRGFEPRPVEVRSTGSGTWIVLNGLESGELVAVSGTAVLKGMSVGMGGGDG